jgi:hypothetical protein
VFGNVGTISTPTDGSVTANKIGSGAVTNAKIADSTLDLTSKVTGILPVANGGTGMSTAHAFYMYRSASQQINHATGFNLIQFDATRINEGNGVTTGSSARYTVPTGADGIYVLHAKGRLEGETDGNASIAMRLNGTAIATTYYYHQYFDGMSVNMLRNLSAGDYVDVGMSNSIGVSVNVGGADAGDVLYFYGYRLG